MRPRTGRALSVTAVGAVTRFATPALSSARVPVLVLIGYTIVGSE